MNQFDIPSFHSDGVLNRDRFRQLSNVAREYSYKTLSTVARPRSDHTVKKYLDHLEEAFLFFSVAKLSLKMKEQLSSNKKLYSIDIGFVTARAMKASPDIGHLCENVAAIELKRRALQSGREVFFWKNPQQGEVDFVVREGHVTKELIFLRSLCLKALFVLHRGHFNVQVDSVKQRSGDLCHVFLNLLWCARTFLRGIG